MSAPPQTAPPESKSDSPPQSASAGAALLAPREGDRSSAGHLSDPSGNLVLAGLPLQLDVSVPVPNFRVRDLLALEKGTVLTTAWPHAEDVPVWCGGSQLVWTEFEVVDNVLAVRVTRVL